MVHHAAIIMPKPAKIMDSKSPRMNLAIKSPTKFFAAAEHMRIIPQTEQLKAIHFAVGTFCMMKSDGNTATIAPK